jgi:hypothetical protein
MGDDPAALPARGRAMFSSNYQFVRYRGRSRFAGSSRERVGFEPTLPRMTGYPACRRSLHGPEWWANDESVCPPYMLLIFLLLFPFFESYSRILRNIQDLAAIVHVLIRIDHS